MMNINDVYKDWRGEIHRCELNGIKFNVLFTKKGAYRSGDYHKSTQYDLILSGKVNITMRSEECQKDFVTQYSPNSFITIPPDVPHLFEAVSDSIIIEWWDGPFEATYYRPYRQRVEEQLRQHEGKV